MPQEIDTAALNEKKILDITKPPTRAIPFLEFPKMLYLHPKDKSKEHLTKVVESKEEEAEWTAKGWRDKPHIAVAKADSPDGFEADVQKAAPPAKEAPKSPAAKSDTKPAA